MRQLLESFYRGEWPNSHVGRWIFFAAVLAAGSFAAFSTPHRFHRWAAFVTGFVLYPGAVRIYRAACNRWPTAYTVLLVAVVWVGFGYCIVTWGNHQFAAWDLSL